MKMKKFAFALWKETGSFPVKNHHKTVAAALLKVVSMSGLFSEKTGKTYDAVVCWTYRRKVCEFQTGISAAAGTEE
ncbi:MAG: hypothetical protein ACLRXC_09240 [[Clostridium] leptum]